MRQLSGDPSLVTYIACEHRGVALLHEQWVVLADGDPGKIWRKENITTNNQHKIQSHSQVPGE